MTADRATNASAVVRSVPDSYERCIRPEGERDPIDVGLARRQHAAYCALLERLGLDLVRLDGDERHPDCCFVEDTAVVAGHTAVVCEMGAPSRRGEEAAVASVLDALGRFSLYRIKPPATLDGGDVIVAGRTVLVGLGGRTNREAILQLDEVLSPHGLDVVPVPVTGVLHLKSACTAIAPGVLLVAEPFAGLDALSRFKRVVVPRDEGYAANCLSVGGTVVLAEGFPRTREAVESQGWPTETIAMGEFRKGGGSLTCLSILLEAG